jgi:hypothetical protein
VLLAGKTASNLGSEPLVLTVKETVRVGLPAAGAAAQTTFAGEDNRPGCIESEIRAFRMDSSALISANS